MLSGLLVACGFVCSFMWMHNAIVQPRTGTWFGTIGLVGYNMILFTSVIMDHPNKKAVNRVANIFLFTNIPFAGKAGKLIKFHTIGVVSFALLPVLVHITEALSWGRANMENYWQTLILCAIGVVFALGMGASGSKTICKLLHIPRTTGDKFSILFETCTILTAIIEFMQFEFYASAACAGNVNLFQGLLLVAIFTPFALMAKRPVFSPGDYTLAPSVMLMKDGEPVAISGPCSAVAFNQKALSGPLPHVKSE